jgi:hypothetical protein
MNGNEIKEGDKFVIWEEQWEKIPRSKMRYKKKLEGFKHCLAKSFVME